VPRFRQRIEWVPGFGQPVWVDDAHFNPRFHVRHTALPPPGDIRQLKRLAGRVLSQELDRGKPLWEDWFVEGLEGDRFAVIAKVHHCMADGISGVALGELLVGRNPEYEPPPRKEWIPRPAPSASQLVLGEVRHQVGAPLELLRRTQSESGRGAPARPGFGARLRSLLEMVSTAGGNSQTPLNVEIGPHRRFDWTKLPFDEVRAIGKSAGGTLNDAVLAIASGALRSFLRRRGVSVDDIDFRAAVPVSLRQSSKQEAPGNRVSTMIARLPLDELDPWKRLLRIIETTHELKGSGQSGAGEFLVQVMELLPGRLQVPVFRRLGRGTFANTIITNVPGPRFPVYMLGARQLELYPVAPLGLHGALSIALLSYDEGLFWGFISDWDAVPDLHDLVGEVEKGFEQLRDFAGLQSEERERPAAHG
jgi:diacylglycerol O-acyltransferase